MLRVEVTRSSSPYQESSVAGSMARGSSEGGKSCATITSDGKVLLVCGVGHSISVVIPQR